MGKAEVAGSDSEKPIQPGLMGRFTSFCRLGAVGA
jgi:hypothetical protein